MRLDPLRNVPDDAQLDAEVTRYARDHNVSYTAALKSVTAIYAAHQDVNMSQSGAAAHVEITRYAQEHGVSYAEAESRVAQTRAAASDIVATPGADRSDWALHHQAVAYAAQHGVSYCEALRQCAPSFETPAPVAVDLRDPNPGTVGFSEANPSAVAALEGQMIEIFKAGSHISDGGQQYYYSPRDIADIANGYRPSIREAPLVEGHPATDEPSKGWVERLEATPDGRLLMKAKQVDPAFADGVKAGRFKKRSASFYPPDHPNNPNPGKWYLRHVGWLGAQQPAISGLRDVGFA